MSVAIVGAVLLGEFFEAASIAVLFGIADTCFLRARESKKG